jgi:tRNA pseudouridine13 synthase
MKIKQRREDFRVEEESLLDPGQTGVFTLYRLSKSGIGTPEALRRVAKRWGLARNALSVSGLKDTHGVTGQMLTIRGGPATNLDGGSWRLNYLGRVARPADGGCLVANRFRIIVRDLSRPDADRFLARAAQVAETGFPDYYDDQRFGSLRGTGGRFIARALLERDFEQALRLSIASPDARDKGAVRRRRALLAERWGDWAGLAEELPSGFEQTLCTRLAAGEEFEAAYGRVDRELRRLHLSAFQAHLFNTCLRALIPDGPAWQGEEGDYRFFEGWLEDDRIPLAAADAEAHPLLDAALADAGVDRDALASLPFRAGARSVVSTPAMFGHDAPVEDELNRGRWCVALRFSLRPGSYATMLVKRCGYDMRSGTTSA